MTDQGHYDAMSQPDPARAKPPIHRAKTEFLHLPNSKPVDVVFDNITFTVPTGSLFSRRRKQVLRGVSGRFISGELTAIMGPSGAGKSSLLNILSGFQRQGMKGTILGATKSKVDEEVLLRRKDCCYIMQDDNLTPLLTAGEVMMIATHLKLDQAMSTKAKLLMVENIMDNLGLSTVFNVQCGRLSGGQRKRLSVALELISNPPVMFLDEPTTGLDSQSTLQVVSLLKNLARGGRAIICTVHQPSASVFEMFDHVYIIAAGYCMYQGGSTNMVSFLQSVGLPCPKYHNPADFVLDVISGDFGDHTEVLMDAATTSLWRSPPPLLHADKFNCDEDSQANQNPPSEWYRFRILLKRSLQLMFRDWTVVYLKLILHIVVGLMVGILFQSCGVDGSKSVPNVAYCMSTVVYLSYTSLMPAILKFPTELGVIKKEQFNSWYKLPTYYAAFQLANLPIQMIFGTQYTAISYYLTSQIMQSDRFLMFLLVNIESVVISECVGLGLGTTINPVNGIFLGAVGICLCILLGGFVVLLGDMPRIFYYVSYISFMRYAFEGMVLSIYSFGRENLDCGINYCHFRTPITVLDQLSMRNGHYWTDVWALVAIAVFSIFYAYYSLRAKMKW